MTTQPSIVSGDTSPPIGDCDAVLAGKLHAALAATLRRFLRAKPGRLTEEESSFVAAVSVLMIESYQQIGPPSDFPPKEPQVKNDLYLELLPNTDSDRTEELVPGMVFADFTYDGRLVGIEVLGAAKYRLLVNGGEASDEPHIR